MEVRKSITISLISALVAFGALSFGNLLFFGQAQANDDRIYTDSAYPFILVKSSYHWAMNDFFNERLYVLSEIMEKDDFYDDPRFSVPEGVNNENYKVKCVSSVSTYCVSMLALDIYMEYTNTLNEMAGQLPARDPDSDVITSEYLLGDLFKSVSARNEQIRQEFDQALQALEATVSAYNEYRLAYPMHREYEEIIKSLIKYRRALTVIYRRARSLPGKFIDATSVYCD